jgi:hypothetical protein
VATDKSELALVIRAEIDRAVNDIRRFRAETGKELGQTTAGAGQATAAFGKLRNLLGVIGVGFSLTQVIGQMRAAVREAAEAERVEGRLAAVLQATGRAADFSAEQLLRFGDNLAATTRFTDEEAKGAITTLLTFTNIAAGAFDDTLRVAADLAAVMETDLRVAAETLGKVITSPEKGFGLLGRKVQDLTDAQKELVKQMLRTGDVAGAQAFILRELEARVGGAAAGENTGLFKATNDVSKAWDDMLEAFGRTPAARQGTIATLGAITFALRALEGQAVDAREELERTLGLRGPRALTPEQGGRGPRTVDREAFARAMAEAGAPAVRTAPPASEEFKKALADIERRTALLGKETAAEQLLFDLEHGRFSMLIESERRALLAAAQRFDLRRTQVEREREFTVAAEADLQRQIAAEAEHNRLLEEEADALRDLIDPTRALFAELERINRLRALGKLSQEEFIDATLEAQGRLEEIGRSAGKTADEMEVFFDQMRRNLQTALADEIFDLISGNFDNLGESFVRMLRRMAAELAASQLLKFLQTSFGLLPTPARVAHAGGVVGHAGATRAVSPLWFAAAPRLHAGGVAGLRPGEVPIIAQRGEVILPADALHGAAAPPVRVVVENRGTPIEATGAQVTLDPEAMVVRVVTQDLQRGGPLSGAFSRRFGGRR